MKLDENLSLHFVAAVSRDEVLQRCLMSSPLWAQNGEQPTLVRGARSAAEAFNPEMERLERTAALESGTAWLVWVHQDVVLPGPWLAQWHRQLQGALQRWPHLSVCGVYGLQDTGVAGGAVRAGHVVDRGYELHEPAALPHPATSLDELLLAVRVGRGLRLDPALGFDFYATDVCLQAQARGWACAVLDACCEHHSDTPRRGPVARTVLDRIARSGAVFERKWATRLPVTTPCFDIRAAGDVAAFLAAHTTPVDGS